MRPLPRNLLRRYIHSFPSRIDAAPRRAPGSTKLALGASLAVAGYVTWRIAGTDQRIALDSSPQRRSQKLDRGGASDTDAAVVAATTTDPPTKPDYEPADVPIQVGREGAPGGEEDDGEGAFNPETGEINWDCPCLGGMAHGPCGEQFREAFSCFVFSEQEPKGIDCVEKFKNMQDCFREHPDVYGEEIADDGDEDIPEPPPAGTATVPLESHQDQPSASSKLEQSFLESRPTSKSKPQETP